MRPSNDNRLWTPAEAAEVLAVSPCQLSHMRKRGTGPAFVKVGRSVRYVPADVARYITERRRGGTLPATGVIS